MMNRMVKKYTSKRRSFKLSPCGRFYRVYVDGQLSGFVWNNEKVIRVDGDQIVSSEFFKEV